MIIYSVANKQSFEMARIIRDKILNHLVSYIYLDEVEKHASVQSCSARLRGLRQLTRSHRPPKPSRSSSSETSRICDPNSAKLRPTTARPFPQS